MGILKTNGGLPVPTSREPSAGHACRHPQTCRTCVSARRAVQLMDDIKFAPQQNSRRHTRAMTAHPPFNPYTTSYGAEYTERTPNNDCYLYNVERGIHEVIGEQKLPEGRYEMERMNETSYTDHFGHVDDVVPRVKRDPIRCATATGAGGRSHNPASTQQEFMTWRMPRGGAANAAAGDLGREVQVSAKVASQREINEEIAKLARPNSSEYGAKYRGVRQGSAVGRPVNYGPPPAETTNQRVYQGRDQQHPALAVPTNRFGSTKNWQRSNGIVPNSMRMYDRTDEHTEYRDEFDRDLRGPQRSQTYVPHMASEPINNAGGNSKPANARRVHPLQPVVRRSPGSGTTRPPLNLLLPGNLDQLLANSAEMTRELHSLETVPAGLLDRS